MNKEKKLIPELRFPEFENKGEWENDELGNHCDITTGKLDANAMVENGKYRFYTCAKDYYFIDNYAFDTDALLISGNGAHVGYIHHYKGKFNAYQRTYVLDKFDKDIHYVQYFLERNLKGRIASEKKDGNTPYIVRSTLSEMEILSPKSEIEQQKIASCLSSLDELLAAHNEKLEALKDHKKGLMQNLFPQEGETVPKVRFKEFQGDGDWVEKRLGKIGEPLMCKRIFKDQTTPNSENGIPFYKIGTFGKEPDAYIPVELYEEFKSKYNFPNKGDILISASGTIGRLVIYDDAPAYFQDSNIVWLGHDGKQVSNDFLYHCYSIVNWQTSDGGVIKRLYNSDLKAIPIKFPENEIEQQKIASCLSAVDELITAQADKIEQLQQHKKGLMQGLFP